MGNPWYRAYVGTLSDPKIAEAALIADAPLCVVFTVWHGILESASDVEDRGAFATTPRRLAATTREPTPRIEAVFAALSELGMIRDGAVVAWEIRQPPSESRGGAAERQRDARARRAATPASDPDLPGSDAVTACHNLSQPVTASHGLEGEEETEKDSPPPPGGARADSDLGKAKSFGEQTGATVLPFPTRDPLEVEARLLATGLELAKSKDFSPVSQLIASGLAEPGDVLAAIEDARGAPEAAPKSWARFAGWIRTSVKRRRRAERRGGQAQARAGPPPAADAQAHFEAVWAGFPRDKTASKSKAEAAFAELSPDDQRGFAAAIHAVAAHVRSQKLTQPYDLARFIVDRRFEGFSGSFAAAAKKFKIARDSPAGEAWERHWRAAKGRGAPWNNGIWYFDTELPPAGAARASA